MDEVSRRIATVGMIDDAIAAQAFHRRAVGRRLHLRCVNRAKPISITNAAKAMKPNRNMAKKTEV